MPYVALYRKYRPTNFSNIVGQKMIVNILKNSIKSGHISHAYLFAGPRGTGKTSIAKIFARAVNCQNFNDDVCDKCTICNALKENDIDILEIDAASNNGVDEIRSLRDNVKLMPSFCKYKIYIIDEVHMLSTGAFNALLKTLEEPPSHVIFILATTEPNKLPLTILSRVQRFDFERLEFDKISNRLTYILQEENQKLPQDVISYISTCSDGCLRDAINLLDQTISLGKGLNTKIIDVEKLSGKISKGNILKLLKHIIDSDYLQILEETNNLSKEGKNLYEVGNLMLNIVRDLSIYSKVNTYFDEEYSRELKKLTIEDSKLILLSNSLNEMLNEIKNSNNQQVIFEIYMMHFSKLLSNKGENELSEEIKTEKKVSKTEISISTSKVEKKEEITFKSDDNLEEDLDFKKIRINNVLAGASKEELKTVNIKYDNINDYFSNKKYNAIVELLNNGKIVVASTDYLLFAFQDEAMTRVFDTNLKRIEAFILKVFEKDYKVAAITESEWSEIKEDYIQRKKNNKPFVLMTENNIAKMSESNSDLEEEAAMIFGESNISVL